MVAVEPGMMVISFQTGGFLGLGASTKNLEFPFEHVVNVERIGKSVRFEIPNARVSLGWPADSPKIPFFQFWATNEAEAGAIVDALPHAKTAEVAQRIAEEATFEEQLKATTPTPWVSPALVAINVVVFAMMVVAGAGLFTPDGAVHVAWGSNFGPYTTDGQWWRLFTSMFLHFGLIHIALNMWALWDLGRLAERLYGNWVFLALYILAGLAGSIASVTWNNNVNSAGASGAIFGVLGALLAYMLDKRNEVPISVMKKHRNATLAFIAYSLFYGLSHKGVDNAAHIGGLVAGVILGFAMARPLDPARRQGVARIAIPIAIAAVALVLLTLPLRGVGEHFREDQKFRQALNDASTRETVSVAAAKKIADEAAKGLLTGPQATARFEREVAAPYRQSATEIGNIRLDSGSKLAELHQMSTRYFNSRIQAYDLMLDAMRLNDDAKIKLATEKLLEGNKIVSDFNAKKSAGK
jgi:rhomboid protease GluP